MSFQAMTWAVEQKCKSATQKLVLLMLANHANHHTGQCNPSHKRLADECSMSVSGLKKQLKELDAVGYIKTIRIMKNGVNLPNQYELMIENRGTQHEGVGHLVTEGGSPGDRGVGHDVATKLETKPINEPIKEKYKKENTVKQKRFDSPIEQEVEEFEKNENLNLSGFFDYYESNGWMVGKNKMKNWKAAARGWSRRQSTYQQQKRGRDECFSEEYWQAVESA